MVINKNKALKAVKKTPLDRYYNVDSIYGLLSEFSIRREIKRLKVAQREILVKMENLEAALKRKPDMELEPISNGEYKTTWLNKDCPYTPEKRGLPPIKNEYTKYE